MMTTLSLFILSFTMMVPSIICDYQLEVTLITYNNSQGRLQNGDCCDLDDGQGRCLPQDTCDVRFSFSVQNFNTLTTFHSQTKVLDMYENTDVINFPNCSVLINDVRNPLKFVIPTSQWSAGQVLRVLAAIFDVDRNPTTGALELPQILGTIPIRTITRPAAPSATFSSTQTFNGANSLTLMFQYRVICTPGTCGPDCSQTSNCEAFPSCTPITCDDQPCLNGGTCNSASDSYTCTCPAHCNSPPNCAMCEDPCSPVNPCLYGGTCNSMGATYTCTCRQGYTGDRCTDIDLSTNSDITTTAVQFTDTSTGVQSTGGASGPSSGDESTTETLNQTDGATSHVASLSIISCIVLMILPN